MTIASHAVTDPAQDAGSPIGNLQDRHSRRKMFVCRVCLPNVLGKSGRKCPPVGQAGLFKPRSTLETKATQQPCPWITLAWVETRQCENQPRSQQNSHRIGIVWCVPCKSHKHATVPCVLNLSCQQRKQRGASGMLCLWESEGKQNLDRIRIDVIIPEFHMRLYYDNGIARDNNAIKEQIRVMNGIRV